MKKNNKKKIEPWRIVVFGLATVFIAFLWVKKDVAEIYKTMPQEQIIPLVLLTVGVSLLKVLAIAGVVLLVKLFVTKKKD